MAQDEIEVSWTVYKYSGTNVSSPTCGIYIENLNVTVEELTDMKDFYKMGSHADSYNAIVKKPSVL
ncbi:MAG: hypothetical protein ACI3XA_07290 [Clostridia bacterium]